MATPRPELVHRSNVLLDRARFTTLATHGPRGTWASTVNYVALRGPLRLLWCSLREARHSRDIENAPTAPVGGSLFMTGLDTPLGLDGAQYTGTAEPVVGTRLQELSEYFYRTNFPDEAVRQRLRLPLEEFAGPGPRRFYLLTVREWWVLDTDGWLRSGRDGRVQVPLEALHGASAGHGVSSDVPPP
ncbi:pyridoxamine 5'-phosphate oxidase family protein [Streptomyces sp. NPDC093252]|uniref:pyridoxamine 5'-phosphate oxidase family protein n=1 Tax=Streptomyces sp. NPDC093252 TaxID=3154980 RepID=UPI00343E669D